MTGEITRIDSPKQSKNEGEVFIRIHFKMFHTGGWAKTDIVRTFRNYKRWRPLLKKGNIITGLQMLDENSIDADSYPRLRERPDLSLEDENLMNLSKQCL